MADQTQSIANSLSVFGPEPAIYNVAVYGTDTYGDTQTLDLQVGKFLSESITPSDAYGKTITHPISDSFSFLEDFTTSERVGDGGIYFYDFPPVNAENRPLTVWTEV